MRCFAKFKKNVARFVVLVSKYILFDIPYNLHQKYSADGLNIQRKNYRAFKLNRSVMRDHPFVLLLASSHDPAQVDPCCMRDKLHIDKNIYFCLYLK